MALLEKAAMIGVSGDVDPNRTSGRRPDSRQNRVMRYGRWRLMRSPFMQIDAK